MIKMTSRTYSKWMVAGNSLAAWGTINYAIYMHESVSVVATVGFSFVVGLSAYYMRVGHNDLKETLQAVSPRGQLDKGDKDVSVSTE